MGVIAVMGENMGEIRRMRVDDVERADAILRAAHRTDSDYSGLLRRNRELTPDSWWVLEEESGVMGVVGATDFGTFAHVGLMAVDPVRQVSGGGGRLLDHLLGDLEGKGFPTITLFSTDAGLRFYWERGFAWKGLSTEWEVRKWRRARAREGRVDVGMVEDVLELDARVVGGDRGPLLRSLIGDHPGRLLVAWDGEGKCCGYVMALRGNLGPFVAETREVAGQLLEAAMELDYTAGGPRVILPEVHAEGESLMIECGFRPVRTSRYLVRGADVRQERGKLYGAVAYSLG